MDNVLRNAFMTKTKMCVCVCVCLGLWERQKRARQVSSITPRSSQQRKPASARTSTRSEKLLDKNLLRSVKNQEDNRDVLRQNSRGACGCTLTSMPTVTAVVPSFWRMLAVTRKPGSSAGPWEGPGRAVLASRIL